MVALKRYIGITPTSPHLVKQERRGGIETGTTHNFRRGCDVKQERRGGIETPAIGYTAHGSTSKQERRGGIET